MPKLPPEPTLPTSKKCTSFNSMTVSRRRFGRNAAAIAALTVSPASLMAVARDPRGELAAGTRPLGQTKAEDNAKLGISPEQAAEVDAKLANIIRKFGSRLSDEQRQHLRRILAYNERMLAGVRAFSIQNGDPPASVLRISPMREIKPDEAHHGGSSAIPAAIGKKPEGVH
jgi:hypothetical protein